MENRPAPANAMKGRRLARMVQKTALWRIVDDQDAHPGGHHMTGHARGSITAGIVWMFLIISILLFWLPVVGLFIAGLVEGKKSGGFA